MKLNIRTSLLVGILCLGSTLAHAAENAYLHIKMANQGEITGSSSKKGYEKWIQLDSVIAPRDLASGQSTGKRDAVAAPPTVTGSWIDFGYDVRSPRDAATGLATGKRMHKPFTFSCTLDRVGQQMLQALMSHERCVEITVCIVGDDGKIVTGILSEPDLDRVSLVKSENQGPPTEEISFTYQKITWNN